MIKKTSKTCFFFPGHAFYDKNMIKSLSEKFSVVRNTIKYGSRILGLDLFNIMNNERKLKNTLYLQVLVTIVNISIWRLWNQKNGILPIFFSGHSLGEYSALVCNNNLSFKDLLYLINKRSFLMSALFKKEKMDMFVLSNIDLNSIYFFLSKFKSRYVFYISVLNSKKQIICSVKKKSIKFFLGFLKEKSVKLFILNFKIASHCIVLNKISKDFKKFFIETNYFFNECKILHNLNINYCINKNYLIDLFVNHLCKQINWIETLKYIEYFSIKAVFEFGAGQTLKKLIERTTGLICKNINNYYDFKKNIKKFNV